MASKKKARKIKGPTMKITGNVMKSTGNVMNVKPRTKVAAKKSSSKRKKG